MTSAVRASASPRPRFGGLDGLRAIAVALVLIYHLFPGILPGGFLGVDVFFVISGFLISSLLLHEHETTGRVRLGNFWKRRARRLLPALGLVLVVGTAGAKLIGGDVLVGIASQIAGATFFVSNWVFIATGADYFAKDNPEIFRNTWSLSIEEQFYLLLPLILLAALKLGPKSARIVPFLALGSISALLMAQLSTSGAEPTRIYFGSDTHTFGLLFGVALAFLLHRPVASLRSTPPSVGRQVLYLGAAIAGFACLGWLAITLTEASPESFRGGFQLATLASLIIVWAVTRPEAWIGRALDIQPLRWIGERSYGIYLWHWPLLILVSAADVPWAQSPAASVITGCLVLVATLVLSALSFSFIEQPVRRNGLRRSVSVAIKPLRFHARVRWITAGTALVLALSLPLAVAAVVTAPVESSAASAIARGQQALDEQTVGPEESIATEDGSAADDEKKAPDTETQEDASSSPTPVPEGRDITAVGDSVMLASLPELDSAFPGISVDAAVSRGLGVGVEISRGQVDAGAMRSVLVLGLGTNGPIDVADLEQIRAVAAPRPVVLVNAHGERDWIPGVNESLAAYAAEHRGVVVADWDGLVSGVPDALAGDDIHPNPSGGDIYAAAIAQAIAELAQPGEAIGYGAPRL